MTKAPVGALHGAIQAWLDQCNDRKRVITLELAGPRGDTRRRYQLERELEALTSLARALAVASSQHYAIIEGA